MLESILGVISLLSLIGAIGYLIAAVSGRRAKRTSEWIGAGVSSAIFILSLVIGSLAAKPPSKPAPAAALRPKDEGIIAGVGEPAPAFKLKSLDGKVFDLKSQRGKVVLLNYFATWCGPCQEELLNLDGLWKLYGDRSDFSMLVIDRGEPEKTAKAFVGEKGFAFPVAADPENRVFPLYATESIPRTFLISREGTVVHATMGYFEGDAAALQLALERELAKPSLGTKAGT